MLTLSIIFLTLITPAICVLSWSTFKSPHFFVYEIQRRRYSQSITPADGNGYFRVHVFLGFAVWLVSVVTIVGVHNYINPSDTYIKAFAGILSFGLMTAFNVAIVSYGLTTRSVFLTWNAQHPK